MPLTPLDIRNKEFRKTFRGYDEEEVDEFLDRVVNEYERIFKENGELKEALAAKESNIGQYKDLEDTLQKTLVIAQQAADDVKQGAAREAEVLIKEAQLKAEQIVAGAEEKARSVLNGYEETLKHGQILKVQLRSFLLSQLDIINNSGVQLPSAGSPDKNFSNTGEVDQETMIKISESA